MHSSYYMAAAALAALACADDSSSTTTATSTITATTGVPATSTHDVKVGSNGLNFEPDTLSASPGDLIHFHFFASNHSAAQSSFDKPCQPLEGGSGIYSGFFAVSGKDEAPQVFSMRLNESEPVWLYCSSGEHCKGGQSMVINPSSGSDQTLQKYKEEAKKADVKSPDTVNGGVVHDKPTTSSTGTATASASSAAITKSAANGLKLAGASSAGLMMAVAGMLMLL